MMKIRQFTDEEMALDPQQAWCAIFEYTDEEFDNTQLYEIHKWCQENLTEHFIITTYKSKISCGGKNFKLDLLMDTNNYDDILEEKHRVKILKPSDAMLFKLRWIK
jgi:hypothetical protein